MVTNKNGEKFLVIKVNAKSFYLAKGITLKKYNALFSVKSKGETFKQFCDKNNFKMFKYDDFEVVQEEEKAEISDNVLEKKFNYVDTAYLNQNEKMILATLKENKELTRYQNIITNDGIMRVMDLKDKDKLLLNVNSNYVLYNMTSDNSYKVCSIYDWDKQIKQIPWEKVQN